MPGNVHLAVSHFKWQRYNNLYLVKSFDINFYHGMEIEVKNVFLTTVFPLAYFVGSLTFSTLSFRNGLSNS